MPRRFPVIDGGNRRPAVPRMPPQIREVPLNGATHQMLKLAVLSLEALQKIDLFRETLRLLIKDTARSAGIGIPATLDAANDIIKEFAEELPR